MPAFSKIALFSSLVAYVASQQVGTNTPETHPSLPSQKCTKAGGCVTASTKIVLDANWRWLHSAASGSFTNCYTGNKWDAALCPNNAQCTANCALEGADYSGTYGVSVSGNAVTLKFVTRSSGTNVGSRIYLLESDTAYDIFMLKNKEFTFDVDVSNLPCGINGALYFVEMDKDGGVAKYPTNKAGAKYGTGYCDAQCPHDLKFIGQANVEGWISSSVDSNAGSGGYGSCCPEMDIWEANSISSAYTPHPCDRAGLYKCTAGPDCGDGADRYAGNCDKDGCDFNSYRQNDKTFYGPGKTVDTTKKMTVVTQFITDDGTDTGKLVQTRRIYVQNGVAILNSVSNWPGIPNVNSITDAYCVAQKSVFGDNNFFNTHGGLTAMGNSLGRGHVLTMSIWSDYAAHLLWLNSPYPVDADPNAPGISRGSCSTTSGDPPQLISSVPNSSVTYSNIKSGELCSTFQPGTLDVCGGPGTVSTTARTSSTTRTTTRISTTSTRITTTSTRITTTPSTTPRTTTTPSRTSTTTTRTSTGTGPQQTKWGQCGGIGYNGPTSCVSGSTCTTLNPYYSQCL